MEQSENKHKTPPNTLAMLWDISLGGRLLVLLAVVCSGLSALFGFLTPQIIRVTLDSILDTLPFALPAPLLTLLHSLGGREFLRENLWICALLSLLCAVAAALANLGCRMALAKSGEGILKRLRDRLFNHIGRLPYAWHVKNQTGDIIQRCTSDVDVLRNFLSRQVLELFRVVFMVAVALVLMFSMNVKLSLVSLAFVPVVVLYSGLFQKKLSKRFHVADEAEGALSSVVQENLTGVRVVRAFGREAYEVERFDVKNEGWANLWIRFSSLLGIYWGVGDFASSLQVMVIILFGVLLTIHGELTLGAFIVFVTYNAMISWPLRSLGRILGEMSKMGVSLGRLREILDEEQEADDPNALIPPMNRDIAFRNIRFRYENGPEILRDISFHVEAGSTIGILGGTGSGKSTLVCLLNRLYALEEGNGSITVGGVDIQNIRLSHLRKNIGFVLQEPFLFSKTIAENIKDACPQRSDEEMRLAAQTAAVDETILGFSQGYETVIGEKGVTLSGGQKQRVAIARMLLQNTPIKIFDDSLSAIDTETDAKIRAALRRDAKSATVFIISHRITSIMHADKILVLEDGCLVQEGTHMQLSVQEGIYKRIYDLQRQTEEDAS